MPATIRIDHGPCYELLVSLFAFVDRQRWKGIDLGTAWGKGVQDGLTPDQANVLQSVEIKSLIRLLLLIPAFPGDRSADSFLNWLSALGRGELYEALNPANEPGCALPPDLQAWRNAVVTALRCWDQVYFRTLDPAVGEWLHQEAAARAAQAPTLSPAALIDAATNGVLVGDDLPPTVVLVPQYHLAPLNIGAESPDLRLLLYPIERPPASPSDPPPGLVRLTRALGDETRLRILHLLGAGPLTLGELTERTGLAKSTVHHHMMMLRAASLVAVQEEQREARYLLREGALDQLANRLRNFVRPT